MQGEIDAREDSFVSCDEAGERLVNSNHYAADEVREKVGLTTILIDFLMQQSEWVNSYWMIFLWGVKLIVLEALKFQTSLLNPSWCEIRTLFHNVNSLKQY